MKKDTVAESTSRSIYSCSTIFGLGVRKTTAFINHGTWPMISGSVFLAFSKLTIIIEEENGSIGRWLSKLASASQSKSLKSVIMIFQPVTCITKMTTGQFTTSNHTITTIATILACY